jgi:UDP:flavonoid glycosyltransferase YjiC (YdhE family)
MCHITESHLKRIDKYKMRIGLVTKGSRGDIQPFIALAIGLKKNGHQVTIVTFKNFQKLITDYNIEFCPLSMDIEKEAYTEDVLEVLRKGNMIKFARLIGRNSEKHNEKIILEIDKASDNFDFIIASGLAFPNILPIAVKKNIKYGILNFSMPYSITKEFPAMGFGFQNISFINKISYSIFTFVAIKLFIQKEANQTAKLLNLPNWKTSELMTELLRKNRLIIHPMSHQLLLKPKDWASNSFVTGFLEIPATERNKNINEQIPEALKDWIENGEKPIYIGFGSIPIPDTNLLNAIVNQLLNQTNHRIVFCNGWTKPFIHTKHKNLFVIESISHEWLLPKCKMAIFHGGIGSIGSALKAQIPMIIVSIVADQPFNGKLIEKNKTGIHIPFQKLTYGKLLEGISKITLNDFKENAKSIGEKMHLENGVNESLNIIENYLKQN